MVSNYVFVVIIIIILVILVVLLTCVHIKNKSINKTVWLYWENSINKTTPYYIQICHQLVKKVNPNSNVVILDENSVKKYIDLPKQWYSLKEIAHKADYVRVAMLYKYGGIWLDSDMVCLDSFDKIFDLLDKYDFVAFELKNIKNKKISTNTYKVNTGFLAARPNSILFKKWLDKATDTLMELDKKDQDWHLIGRSLMNPLLKELVETGQIKYCSIKAEGGVLPVMFQHKELFYSETAPLSRVVRPNTYQPFITLFNSCMSNLNSIDKDCIDNGNMLICRLLKYCLDK